VLILRGLSATEIAEVEREADFVRPTEAMATQYAGTGWPPWQQHERTEASATFTATATPIGFAIHLDRLRKLVGIST
jgi:hypothetical protein